MAKHGEDSKGLLGQADGPAVVLAQFTGAKVELKAFETDKSLGGVDCHGSPLSVPKSLPPYSSPDSFNCPQPLATSAELL